MALRVESRRRLGTTALGVLALLALAGCGLLEMISGARPKPEIGNDGLPKGGFQWPAEGRISSGFGPRGNTNHDGIDIAAPEGSPVHVVADGSIIFAGILRGYGKVVIVEHTPTLTTVYAH